MDSSAPIEESSVPKLATNLSRHSYSAQKDGATPEIEPKKRKKLHWGYDTSSSTFVEFLCFVCMLHVHPFCNFIALLDMSAD